LAESRLQMIERELRKAKRNRLLMLSGVGFLGAVGVSALITGFAALATSQQGIITLLVGGMLGYGSWRLFSSANELVLRIRDLEMSRRDELAPSAYDPVAFTPTAAERVVSDRLTTKRASTYEEDHEPTEPFRDGVTDPRRVH